MFFSVFDILQQTADQIKQLTLTNLIINQVKIQCG